MEEHFHPGMTSDESLHPVLKHGHRDKCVNLFQKCTLHNSNSFIEI